ncbi:MAG: NAD/NADP octopine/nopaline dehydrogenase family protein [Acetobacteraceae bacterium]|nr:NAD/NADP octopine/nopaline dehydrogenase family protein [Acetobacteraceae bacterium]
MIVAVLGNSPLNIGAACAAELARAGHAVRVALSALPPQLEVAGHGAVTLRPMPAEAAIAGADLVVVDIPPADLLPVLAPYLGGLARAGAVHVNSHGYWPALRLATAMRRAGLDGFCITDAGAPTHAAGLDGARLTPHARRTGLRIAAAPMHRLEAALPLLRALVPDATPAAGPLATGLEGINLVVHPALALVNLGWFDRAAAAGERVRFYGEGNTASAAALATALDAERAAICAAWGLPHRSLPAMLAALYGATGEDALSAVATCPFYRGLAPQDPLLWRRWLATDVPYGLKPAAALAAARGVPAPLHAGLAAVFDAVLGGTGAPLTLEGLGIADGAPA